MSTYVTEQVIATLINAPTCHSIIHVLKKTTRTKATRYRVTVLHHNVVNDVVTVLRFNTECSGHVVLRIDTGCSDVVQDGKFSLEIADAV